MLSSHLGKDLFTEVLLMEASSLLWMNEVPISWSAIAIVCVPLSVLVPISSPFPHFPTHNIESAPGSDTLFYH